VHQALSWPGNERRSVRPIVPPVKYLCIESHRGYSPTIAMISGVVAPLSTHW